MQHSPQKNVGCELVHAVRLYRSRMGEKLVTLGLFAGQEQVLQELLATGLTTMGALADRLRVRPPTASKTVSRLAAQGLVLRKTQENDARIVNVELTELGVTKALSLELLMQELEVDLLCDFTATQINALRELLQKISTNLQAKYPDTLGFIDKSNDFGGSSDTYI